MRDIASEAGVAASTVSKALRSDPSISPAQCRRIKEIAERLGYRPDPLVALLMSNLHHHRRRSDPHDIAWIDFWDGKPRGHFARDMSAMLGGARARAAELGYGIKVYEAGREKISAQRITRILAAQNQWGLIVPPVPDSAMHLDWNLRGFAAVTIGTSLHEPVLHRVSTNHFQGVTLAFRQMRSLGFKRIGLALSQSMNQRVEERWLGGFVAASLQVPEADRVPPLVYAREEPQIVRTWIRETKPDAVLLAEDWPGEIIKRPLAWLVPIPGRLHEPKIDYQPEHLGRVAVELVVAQIHRNERGSPNCPHTVLLDGVWNEGA